MPFETDAGTGPHSAAADQGSVPAAANVALKHAATRLLQLLERETTALRERQPVDLDDLCHRKNQALLELSRIGRRVDGEGVDEQLRSLLGALRERLDENKSVLALHLQAVGEVADILAAAIRDAESDGTYSTGPNSTWLA
jgi:hypothetical protein